MEISPDYRRLLTVIRLEEPDRVPLAELAIDRPVKEGFLGKPVRDIPTDVECWYKAGYDYLYLRAAYEYPGVPAVVATGTVMGGEASAREEGVAQSVSSMAPGVIGDLDDLEGYPWPDPETIDYSPLVEAAECLPDGMGIISGVGGIFTRAWLLLGFQNFCYALADNPELIARMFERIGSIQAGVLRRIVQMDKVFAVWYGDDLGYTEALIVPPKVYRQYLFPWTEELSSIAHGAGMPFIFHSDGKLWEIIPDFITMGVNVLHPIEPKAMDINEVKARYGDRLALFGNIDLGYTLVRGTPDEVRAEVRQRIKDLAPGGGYAVGSSNTVARYVPVPNFNAMREATFEYGTYPIRL